jgi:molybdate transport system ATP-binding protein
VVLEAGTTITVVNDDHVTGDVFAAIRPEAVSLHRDQPRGSPRNTWRATVTTIDREGPRARVTLDGPMSGTAEITQSALDDLAITPGAPIWASAKATEIEIYPL